MAQFEVQERDGLRMVKATLNNETVRTEAGALYYMKGALTMQSKLPSVSGFFKSMATGESVFRPTYQGTGELFLEPSFGAFHVMELQGEEWILERGAYVASEERVEVDVYRDKVLTSLLSGQGFINFQTKIKGRGKAVITAQGPIEVLQLKNDQLVVDGTFAVARSGGLDYAVERASKSLFGSASSGEFLVSTYRGTGTVLIAPFPYKEVRMIEAIRGLSAPTPGT